MTSAIHFFYEEVDFHFKHIRKTKAWLKEVVKRESTRLGELNYIFCSDEFLANVNVQYLHHDTLTDIITFDTSEDVRFIEGEIFISIDRVKENALKFKVSFEHELHRVMVHGVLHLAGYSDKTSQQKKIMRKKEDAYLSLRSVS
jgi:probable rRNA maturation factor